MKTTRQQLHDLVDMVDEIGFDTLYNVLIRFIPSDEPLPDEIASHAAALEDYDRRDLLKHEDIDWS